MNEKNQWFNDISKLKNDFSQILYLIYYLYDTNEINKEQKLLLKNLLLLNKDSIFKSLQNLKLTHNIKDFSKSIKKLITETNFNNNQIEQTFRGNGNAKHLITISNNSDNNGEDEVIEDIKSPQVFIRKINKK